MTTLTEHGVSIEEAAGRTGVSPHTLRYYERIGLLAPITRGPGGHRRFTETEIGAVVFLTLLRQTGIPIRDMQRFIELTRAGDGTIGDRVEVLTNHRTELVGHIALLRRHLAALDNKIGIYQNMLRAASAGSGIDN